MIKSRLLVNRTDKFGFFLLLIFLTHREIKKRIPKSFTKKLEKKELSNFPAILFIKISEYRIEFGKKKLVLIIVFIGM